MPRYYFHIHDGRSPADQAGVDLPDLTAARREAMRAAAQTMADDRGAFWELDDWRLEVTDAGGMILFSLIVLALASPATLGTTRPDPFRPS